MDEDVVAYFRENPIWLSSPANMDLIHRMIKKKAAICAKPIPIVGQTDDMIAELMSVDNKLLYYEKFDMLGVFGCLFIMTMGLSFSYKGQYIWTYMIGSIVLSAVILWIAYADRKYGIKMRELDVIGKYALWGHIGQPFKQSQFYYDALQNHHEDSALCARRLMECQIDLRKQYKDLADNADEVINTINRRYDYYMRSTIKEDLMTLMMIVFVGIAESMINFVH